MQCAVLFQGPLYGCFHTGTNFWNEAQPAQTKPDNQRATQDTLQRQLQRTSL